MDKLPPEAREFLKHAKGVHDPHDLEARDRIERRLWAALAVGSTGGLAETQPGAAAGQRALGWFGSSKVMLATAVLVFASGGAWLSMRGDAPLLADSKLSASLPVSAPEAKPLPEEKPEVSALPSSEQTSRIALLARAPARLDAVPPPTESSLRERHASTAAPKSTVAASSLADEAALLARASDQLMQQNTEAATSLLQEHSRRYPKSQLHEERRAFYMMTRCLRGVPQASEGARAFVANNPASVLVPRLSDVCAL